MILCIRIRSRCFSPNFSSGVRRISIHRAWFCLAVQCVTEGGVGNWQQGKGCSVLHLLDYIHCLHVIIYSLVKGLVLGPFPFPIPIFVLYLFAVFFLGQAVYAATQNALASGVCFPFRHPVLAIYWYLWVSLGGLIIHWFRDQNARTL